MLTIAFDCGGDDGTEYLTVAGFASSARDWDSFSEQWKKRLDQDGIAFFRTVDANALRRRYGKMLCHLVLVSFSTARYTNPNRVR